MRPIVRTSSLAVGWGALGIPIMVLGLGCESPIPVDPDQTQIPGCGGSIGTGGAGQGGTGQGGAGQNTGGSTGNGGAGQGGAGQNTGGSTGNGGAGQGGTGQGGAGQGGSIGNGGAGQGGTGQGGAGQGGTGQGGSIDTGGTGQGGSIDTGGTGGAGGSTSTTTTTTTSTTTNTTTMPGIEPSGPAPYSSGSRLRARLRSGGNGAVAFAGWRDSQLGQACSFRNGEDGVPRCLPDPDSRAILRYQDSNCTQPVIVRSCGSQAQYVPVVDGPAGCEPASEPYAVYQVGPVMNTQSTYALLGTSCIPKQMDPAAELRQALPVLPDTFVAATRVDEPQGPRMALQVLEGDDGSRETRGVRDALVGAVCTPQWMGQNDLRCLPSSNVTGGLAFADSSCGSPILIRTDNASCPLPPYGLDHSAGDGCNDLVRAVGVGAATTPGQLFQGTPQTCAPLGIVPSNWAFYVEGPSSPAATFPAIYRQQMGNGRLRTPLDLSGEGLSILPPGAFRDSQRDLPCDVQTFSDGTARCVPVNVAKVKFYKNGACTDPVITLSDPECGMPAPTEIILTAAPTSGTCTSSVIEHVHAIGPAFTGGTVYRKSGTNCSSMGASSLGMAIYDLGPEVPADTFAAVTETTQ